jgi:hypothetical protein
MTVLPLVDLLILFGTGCAAIGFILKFIALTTIYRPTFLSFSSLDMLLLSALGFAFALVLTARTWLKLNEPHLQALQRRIGEEEAKRRAQEYEARNGHHAAESDAIEAPALGGEAAGRG